MRKSFFTFFILFLLCFQVIGQNLGFQIVGKARKVVIPFELHNNLIVVPVVLNNQIPLKFVVDTGVRTAILTEKAFSDILGLEYSRRFLISGIGEKKQIEAYITNNVSLTLPGITGKGHALLVLNEDYLELRNYLGADVHGLLGYELFSRFIVKIDYDQKLLTLTTPDNFKLKRSYKKVDMDIIDTKPYINGVISYDGVDSIRVKLLVDTGSSHGLLIEEDSDDRIYIPDKHIRSELGRGLAGKLEGDIARIKYFHIGKYCWKDPIVTFPVRNKTPLDSLKYGDSFRNGSVGGEILSRLKIILDFSGEKIYIKKGKDFKDNFTYNLSGLNVKAKGSGLNTFEIVEVRKNSVGEEAGFQKGDIILSINNLKAADMTLNNVLNFLNSKENKKLKIVIQRDDETLKKVFRLRSEI
ncbi:MAG: aspartyl protease family protein [Fulvivirga sp.]|nr:aspartyl protease family protein [Fulvivirga sp.]